MNLNKSLEFFDPSKISKMCHVIGCGAIGSSVAELLARHGVEKITLWDFDKVESHNIVNQMYTEKHIGQEKTVALKEILTDINPILKTTLKTKSKYTNEILNGYVFMCVDNIDIRKDIVKNNMYNNNINAIFDFRMTLTDGQHYAADWSIFEERKNLLNSMNFTHEEAEKNTPVSACGFTLSVAPTVRIITSLGIANFTNYINNKELKRMILSFPYLFITEAY